MRGPPYAVWSVRERNGAGDDVDFEAGRLLLVAAAVCGSLSDRVCGYVSRTGARRVGEEPGAAFDRRLLVKVEGSDASVRVDIAGDAEVLADEMHRALGKDQLVPAHVVGVTRLIFDLFDGPDPLEDTPCPDVA